MTEQKYILTDIDGVCLDWQKQFEKFLEYYYPDKDPTSDPTARRATLEKEMEEFTIDFLPGKEEIMLEFSWNRTLARVPITWE